jgi:hypothetical protein
MAIYPSRAFSRDRSGQHPHISFVTMGEPPLSVMAVETVLDGREQVLGIEGLEQQLDLVTARAGELLGDALFVIGAYDQYRDVGGVGVKLQELDQVDSLVSGAKPGVDDHEGRLITLQ